MISLDISQEQIEEAGKRKSEKVLKNSITNGESAIYGALGEIVVRDFHRDKKKQSVIDEPTYDYDLIIEGNTVDVKAKKTTVKPKSNYNASISAFNTKQKCKLYYFVRIKEDLSEAYLLGYLPKDYFLQEAKFIKKGEKDDNGWTFKGDCYNLPISRLRAINR